jgi:hypothetical protein
VAETKAEAAHGQAAKREEAVAEPESKAAAQRASRVAEPEYRLHRRELTPARVREPALVSIVECVLEAARVWIAARESELVLVSIAERGSAAARESMVV